MKRKTRGLNSTQHQKVNGTNCIHPNDVQPLGNYYMNMDTIPELRTNGLGFISVCSDEFIIAIFEEFDPLTLCRAAQVSKFFYIVANIDVLWKPHVIDEYKGDFKFEGTWKNTFAKKKYSHTITNCSPQINCRGIFSDRLYQAWYCAQIDPIIWCKKENIERRSNLSVEDFKKFYEEPNKPVVITDIVTKWSSYNWTRELLLKKYGNIPFRTDFEFTDMKLADYLLYCERVTEERPIYLFDNSFGERAPELLTEFERPKYFEEDFFDLLNDHPKDRPSYRWLLVGPTRAGATFHKDPNFTSAWHGLIMGRKKWILYPPDFVPLGVFPSADGQQVTTPDTMVQWFMDFYPLKTEVTPIEFVLKAGELMFIPSGWWHSVVNLEESVAITQNFVSRSNLKNVYIFLKSKKNKSLFNLFSDKLGKYHPELLSELKKEETAYWDNLVGDINNDSNWELTF